MSTRRFLATAVAFAAATAPSGAAPGAFAYPATETVPVTDTYFGVTVPDPYRWLENPADPAVRAWAAAETSLAVSSIEATPAYPVYAKRVAELARTSTARYGLSMRGGHLIYLRQTPPQPQPQLVMRDGIAGAERVLFDPATAAAGGAQPSIETIAASLDGSKVAFTTQLGGSEDEVLHVVDTATGALLPDTVAHVGGGTSPVALAWDGDGKGLLHTQWPRNADGTYASANMAIYHHVLGTGPAADTYVFGHGLSPKAEYSLESANDGGVTAATVADGDGVHASIYLRAGAGPFALVAGPEAGIGDSSDAGGAFVGRAFYAVAHGHDARGEVVALTPGGTFASAKVVVPGSTAVIESVVPLAHGFLTRDIDGGDGLARSFATDGTPRGDVPIPKISRISALAADPAGGPLVVGYENYTTPDTWFSYTEGATSLVPTGIGERAPGDFSHVVAERVFVPSLDGKVKIPLEIVRETSTKLDGTAPTEMTAYGAYGIVSQPFFDASSLAWLERGGILAQAMIRGGGEYGEAWHQAAHLKTKTVSSDDLAACARWLATNHYTSARHLGIIGGSAGGFLMGLALTRDPSLYRAVVAAVGIHDLLRVELTPNGAYNTPEFGTVTDPAQFPWMLAQSPYHNVRAGTAYPAVLMTTGENDPRVDPYMSRKMVAMLQARNAASTPIFLIQRAGQGHGIGNSFDQQVLGATQDDAFFDWQLR